MKLLLDQNLSPHLVDRLSDLYPGSAHVYPLGLSEASDLAVWNYARRNGLVVITRDADFNELSLIRGYPPKVIWIRRGNCTTRDIEKILRDHYDVVTDFGKDSDVGVLVLS